MRYHDNIINGSLYICLRRFGSNFNLKNADIEILAVGKQLVYFTDRLTDSYS